MVEKPALPLCSTCGIKQLTMKVYVMVGIGLLGGIVLMPLLSVLFWFDARADVKIDALGTKHIIECGKANEDSRNRDREQEKRAIARDQDLAVKFLAVTTQINNNSIAMERVLNAFGFNQKRVMEYLDLDYMAPEEVHRDWGHE